MIRPDPEVWLRIIDRMLDDPKYAFAKDFLTDVKEQTEEKHAITNKQTQAVLNIRRSAQLREDKENNDDRISYSL